MTIQPFDKTIYVDTNMGGITKKVTTEKLIYRSPEWFIRKVNHTEKWNDYLKDSDFKLAETYARKMLKGDKFPTSVLGHSWESDGVRRALAAKMLKLKIIPIIIKPGFKG